MPHTRGNSRVNPYVPAIVAVAGLACFLLGFRAVGIGVAVGSLLGFVNGAMLSRRVDIAADMGDVARALLVMQLGLLLACTIIGVVTIILIHFSIQMAVASAAGFAITHLGTLGVFYWTRARSYGPVEREAL